MVVKWRLVFMLIIEKAVFYNTIHLSFILYVVGSFFCEKDIFIVGSGQALDTIVSETDCNTVNE